MSRDVVYGRRGGRWAAAAPAARRGHVERVRCAGGPFDGTSLAIHTHGVEPGWVPFVPVRSAGGRYVLAGGGVYRWRSDQGEHSDPALSP